MTDPLRFGIECSGCIYLTTDFAGLFVGDGTRLRLFGVGRIDLPPQLSLRDIPELRIPMMPISHSDLMPIRSERSDAGLSQFEVVIGISQYFCLFSLS